jgi:tripartite-type tricarboxylate transporter receptor subunit TctC
MAMELFLHRAGIKIAMIPYRGSAPAIQDLLKGDIQVIMDLLSSVRGMIDSGKLRALAITNKSPLAPNIPSLEESGIKGCEFLSWQGVFAPKKTPTEILNKFSEQINKALATPGVQEKLQHRGANVLGGSPAQMDDFIKSEIAKFEAVAQAADIKPE